MFIIETRDICATHSDRTRGGAFHYLNVGCDNETEFEYNKILKPTPNNLIDGKMTEHDVCASLRTDTSRRRRAVYSFGWASHLSASGDNLNHNKNKHSRSRVNFQSRQIFFVFGRHVYIAMLTI